MTLHLLLVATPSGPIPPRAPWCWTRWACGTWRYVWRGLWARQSDDPLGRDNLLLLCE